MNKNKHILVPEWPAPARVHAATTLRTGGVSTGGFASLNPASHVGDKPDHVAENRRIIKASLGLPAEPVWLNQTHSNIAVRADTAAPLTNADASYTDAADVVCAVLTADCLPLLACTTDGLQIAAIHAGWRGLLAGIISTTVTAMQPQTELLIWLGPAIGPQCFEVGDEVRDLFVAKTPAFAEAFTAHSPGKCLADIYQLARIELASLGISQVFGGNHCTVSTPEHFYSYRSNSQTGRMATLIWRD
ncbi:MAG: peptidoglycan editing factor PgeF [Methylococcaceae bacterium]|nr:peptidoglycan editing factor PgeF [Methylococcaceae bacterium]